jgi:hypothetical protein
VSRRVAGLRVLALTGGRRVDLDAFLGMLADVCSGHGWVWGHAVQPTGQDWLRPEHCGAWDAVLCHDLPGLHLHQGEPPTPVGPTPEVAHGLAGLLDRGQGMVVTHHALAGWPAWPGWAEALGGRFLYAPGRLRGRDWPPSGWAAADYTVRVVAPDHPVCADVPDFPVHDELYACPVFDTEVVPLLRAGGWPPAGGFLSSYETVLDGTRRPLDPAHPPASDLLGWATVAGRSPLVYLLPGDRGATFELPPYRRLLANALAWVASPEAHRWAAGAPAPVSTVLADA